MSLGGKPSKYGSVLFRGVGQDLDDEHNPLLYPLLSASSKAYSAKPGDSKGKQTQSLPTEEKQKRSRRRRDAEERKA